MIAINNRIAPKFVHSGVKNFSKLGMKKAAVVLAATATMIPTITNAKTETKPETSEKTVQVQETPTQGSLGNTYEINTYVGKSYFDKGLAYTTGANKFNIGIGADYQYNPTTSLQELGPRVDLSGQVGRNGNFFDFDATAKTDFPLNGDKKFVDVTGYASLGYKRAVSLKRKSCTSIGAEAEGFINLPLDKNFNYQNFNKGAAGVGAKLKVEHAQGFGRNSILTLTADGAAGVKSNFVDMTEYILDSTPDINIHDQDNPYARWGAKIKYNLGLLYLQASGGYFYNLDSNLSVQDKCPYVNAGLGIQF